MASPTGSAACRSGIRPWRSANSGTRRVLLGMLLLALPTSAVAGQIVVEAQEPGRPIGKHAEVLNDSGGTLSVHDVRQRRVGWTPGPAGALMFGFDTSVFWVRWRLHNPGDEPRAVVIDLGTTLPDYADWYVVRGGDVHHSSGGDRRPFRDRPDPLVRNITLPVELAAAEEVEVYLRLANHDGVHEIMPVRLFDAGVFVEQGYQKSLLLTLFHGGVLALALYNLVLFFVTRDPAFGWYSSYVLAMTLWSACISGFGFQFLWPQHPTLNNSLLVVGAGLSLGLFGLFTIEYLQLARSAPKWLTRAIQTCAFVAITAIVPACMNRYAIAAHFVDVAGLGTVIAVLGSGTWLLLRGQRQARFFMAASTILGIGAIANMLSMLTIAPVNLLTTWGIHIGSAIELLLLAVGLADAMNRLKAEKLQAERQSREAQQALNTSLERLVEERTRALEDANARLRSLAVTDELTGAYNRRHFNALCQTILVNNDRDEPVAFCMFDLDNFKAYNDRYGHQAGDTALRSVAEAVHRRLRRSGDTLIRLGGEEFGVLYTASTPAGASAFAEALRKEIVALNIPHLDSSTGFLTASFGVYWRPNQCAQTPEQFYDAADKQLYAAKAAGRNTVRTDSLEEPPAEAVG